MKFWDSIHDRMNEWKGIYQGTTEKNKDKMSKRIDAGKLVQVNNPTSKRTFHKDEIGSTIDQQIDIGDERNVLSEQGIDSEIGEVSSSAIKSIDYDPEREVASVTFHNGTHPYDYRVSPEEMQEMIDADSKGQWLNHIWKYYNRMPGF